MASAKNAVVIALLTWFLQTGCAHATGSQNQDGTDACVAEVGDGSALLQSRVSLDDGGDFATASFSVNEDPEALVELKRSAVQGVHAWVSGGLENEIVTLSFDHQGKSHTYELTPYNIYHKDAEIYAGDELLDVDPPRTYRLREEGKWASVTVHEDGMVQGLLEDNGRVMEITPVSHQEASVAAALIEDYEGEAPAHIIRWVAPPQLQDTRSSMLQQAEPTLPPDEGQNIPIDTVGPGPIEEQTAAALGSWGGVKWYPGCYPGDSSPHEFLVGIAADKAALEKNSGATSKLKTTLETIVNEASFVYEKQLNIKLKMRWLNMDTTGGVYGDCPGSDVLGTKLNTILNRVRSKDDPFYASTHLFTGCGSQWGTIGLAYVGTICHTGGYNTGANKIHGGSSPWLTYAHELGHNFAGKHSFEDGQGRTGGVMDYGDGKLNGHYQFNTKYRKTEMCTKMARVVDKCGGMFQKDSSAPPGPTSPPTTTTTTTGKPSTGGSQCSFESQQVPFCGMWENAGGDKFDWTRKSGKTPSFGTGPDQASDGQHYLFIETSGPRKKNDNAILQSKSPLQLGISPSLSFDYHMVGNSIGTLKVLVGADTVFEKTGQQQKQWHSATIPLNTYAGQAVTVKFVGLRGNSWQGDIAIDNVDLQAGNSGGSTNPPTTPPPTTTTEAPTTMPPTTVAPTVVPTNPPTTMAPTTMTPEPEPEPTTAPPGGGGGGGSLEKRVDDLLKKADSILKLLTDLANKAR